MPVYSVPTERDAQDLLVAACERNVKGEFLARELVHEQTIENLLAFGNRLHHIWQHIQERRRERLQPGR